MKKINQTVLRETRYVAVWTLLLSVLMQAVFLIIGKWTTAVLLGNLLVAAVSVLNFLFLGITVQKAVERDPKDAKSLMKLSQSVRMIVLFLTLAIGVALPAFDMWACIISVFFPRISLLFRPLFGGMEDGVVRDGGEVSTTLEDGGDIGGGENTEE